MELKDIIVTPLVIILVMIVAYIVRPMVTTEETSRFFFPALLLRIFGAILIGFIYQFYYGGGDTFFYHTRGSAVMYDILLDNPWEGITIFFSQGNYYSGSYENISRIPFFSIESSFTVIQIATIFDLITFGTYSATAVFFACVSFCGAWFMFQVLTKLMPSATFGLAISILFVPSVFIWGSGILKDTITLSALEMCTGTVYYLFILKRKILLNSLVFLAGAYLIYKIKFYILLCFIPALIIFLALLYIQRFQNIVLKSLIYPFVFAIVIGCGYLLINELSSSNSKYSLENIATTAQITAYDIAFWTGRSSGSTYVLGELDGTLQSMVRLIPQAVNVSLFRPYFWEVSNPLMFFSAIESFFILMITIYMLFISKFLTKRVIWQPGVIFFLVFSITFAFAVGVSTFNFGTLSRYKIPLLPFYLSAITLIIDTVRRRKKRLQ